MEKILYSSLTAIIAAIFIFIFLMALRIKLFSSICSSLFVSNIVLFFFYYNDILVENHDDLTDGFIYVMMYTVFCCIIYFIYLIYIFVKKSSGRCVCTSCRHPSFEEIKRGDSGNFNW